MGRYLAQGIGPVGKCWPADPCHRHHMGVVTTSGLRVWLHSGALTGGAGGRGGVGLSRLARGRLRRGAGQGDRWSGSPRGLGVDEEAEVASGGGVPTTTRSGDGRWESGKDPTSLVSKEGG
jgi:hypothetical protein